MRITEATYLTLARELGKDIRPRQERIKTFSFEPVRVSVKDLYLVVARQDLDHWQAALVCMKTMPKGILAYDGSRIRLENAATPFEGDHRALTHALRVALPPADGYINWEQDLLGKEVTPGLRSGHVRQLVKESVIQERKRLVKSLSGLLVVEPSLLNASHA